MTFLNAALLFGLGAAAIPPVVHLFSRRKFDEVDWAAMQFLQLSRRTKRKVLFEQFWLMLLRMLLLALFVVGLAAPQVTSRLFGTTSADGPRDVVLLVDGSASMAYRQDGRTAADAAKSWAGTLLDRLKPGDRVAVFQVKQQSIPVVPTFTADREQARNALELLSTPNGTADWAAAVQSALALLETAHPNRDVVVVSDNQRYGWGDDAALAKWELLRRGANRDAPNAARIWVVNIAPDRPAAPANWSLDPIATTRGVTPANRDVPFRSAAHFSGTGEHGKPGVIKLDLDGRFVAEVKPTADAPADSFPLAFAQKFGTGSHLLTLTLTPDDLPSDNRQDFAVDVLPLVPVLVVDGGGAGVRTRGSDFLRDALAPAKDPSPAFAVRTVGVNEWSTDLFTSDVKGPGTPPRVVVLSNVEKLTGEQQQQVEKFLGNGGSVLVTLGDRCDAAAWNRIAFRGGQGFLPARLVEPLGDEATTDAPRVMPASFAHPALEVFKEPLPGGLQTALFPKRWKVDAAAGVNGTTGTAIALLTNRQPLLVERAYGKGRVILATHPLDNSWKTNLIRLPDFVRLAHELMYYLTASRTAERNLAPGQPIVFTPRPDEPPGPVSVQSPDGRTRTVAVANWPAVIDGTTDPGAYKLTTPGGRIAYYAVRTDPREAVLTPNGEDDKKRVAEAVGGLEYITTADEIAARGGGEAVSQDLWWVLLLLVIGVLAAEVWYTRRLTDRGEHNLRRE